MLVALACLVAPMAWTDDGLRAAARRLIGATHQAMVEAASSQAVHRLHYDVGAGTYWLSQVGTDGADIPIAVPLGARIALPGTIRFDEVTTVHQGRVAVGEAFTQFLPIGRTERTTIRLVDTADRRLTMTLMLNPLTGRVSVKDGDEDGRR